MTGKFFVPYEGNHPAAIEIKGHRVLILSTVGEQIWENLDALGGTDVRVIELVDDENEILADLAASINGGVVLSPPGMELIQIIDNLEKELPWIH
ncbi:hypothetical protein BVY02_00470 [bacterium J17]|nr:hypothetical protein BVY02_00470 [bacterium J17]